MPKRYSTLLHYVVWFSPVLVFSLGLINYVGVCFLYLFLYAFYIYILKEENHLVNMSPFMLLILLVQFGYFAYNVAITYLFMKVIITFLQSFMDISMMDVIGFGSFTDALLLIAFIVTFVILVVLNLKYLRLRFRKLVEKKEGI